MSRLKKNDIEGHKKRAILLEKLKEIGITYNAYKQRIRNGWTEEEALIAPSIDARKPFYLYKGESVRKYLKEHGGSYNTFLYHVKRTSVEEAVEITLKHRGNVLYYRDGMTLAKWCKLYGKNYSTEYIKQRKSSPK